MAGPVTGELLMPGDAPPTRALEANERWAKLLSVWSDSIFEVPGLGWRFGLDPIIGLVPVAGDLATALVSFYILSLAIQFQIPRSTVARMTMNVGIDYVLGSIPLVGNIFDFAWKANDRNMRLLERALAVPSSERRRQSIWDGLLIGGIVLLFVAMLIGSIVTAVIVVRWLAHMIWTS